MKFSEALEFHLSSGESLMNNVFRYGSSAWAALIREAREAYQSGNLTEIFEEDLPLLEGAVGEIAEYNGDEVLLEVPEPNWDRPGWSIVYLRAESGIQRLEFES